MENQAQAKQQLNMFYDTNKTRILNSDVNGILDSMIESNFKVISKEHFEILGSIAYMYGMDFITQKEHFNKMIMSNWCLRMKDVNLDAETLTKFQLVVSKITVELIGETKDNLKELLLKEAKFEFNVFKHIKLNIDTIIKNSTFAVGFCVDVNDLYRATKYTYGDLLKINKLIYESLTFPGKYFPQLVAIQTNNEWIKNIQKASEYYDLQKFSLIYFESLLTVKEFFGIECETNKNYLEFLVDDSKLETIEIPSTVPAKSEVENVIDTIDTTEPVDPAESINDTDIFVAGVFEEKLEKKIETVADLIQVQDEILNQEDLVQYVYQFVKNRASLNRKSFEDVFPGINKTEFLEQINTLYNGFADEYKRLAERYMQDIPKDDKIKMIHYVNDIIRSVIVSDTERKAYLLQQFAENQIHTYKQLQQIVGLIEECDICGHSINAYISLRDFMNINTEISEIFESGTNLDFLQTKLSYYKAIIDFYQYEEISEVTETEEISEETEN